MKHIETLRLLQEELEAIERVEEKKRREVSEKIFDPLYEKMHLCEETIKSFHKQYINDMRGKHYRIKPDKYCPFMQNSIAFMILGYTDEDKYIMNHIPVLSLVVRHLFSEKSDIRYQEHLLSIPPTLFMDAKTSYEKFILFLDEYCEEISDEEFHKLFINEISKVEETDLKIIQKKEEKDDDDMNDAIDVVDESEDDE